MLLGGAPDASDNVGVESDFGTAASENTFQIGSTTVTYTVRDAAGLTGTCSFNVIVGDGEAPQFTSCPTAEQYNTLAGESFAVVDHASLVSASDNYDNDVTVTLTSGAASGSDFSTGTYTIVYEARDDNDNTATCSFDISIVDNEDPVVVCPGQIVNTDAGQSFATVSWSGEGCF